MKHGKIGFVVMTVMVFSAFFLKSTHALEWGVIDKFANDLLCSVNEAQAFAVRIDNLEYTVIQTEEYKGKLLDLLCYYSEFCNHNKPDDVVTIIDIRKNTKCIANETLLLSDVIKCLHKHILEGNKNDNYTENMQVDVHTLQYRELTNFEIFNKDLDSLRRIHDFIQTEVHNCIYSEINTQLKLFLHNFISNKIARYFAYSFNPSDLRENSSQKFDFSIIRSHLSDALYNGAISSQGCAEVMCKFKNNQICVSKIISNVMKFQITNNCLHYDSVNLEAKIKYGMSNKTEKIFVHTANRLEKKLAANLRMSKIECIERIYRQIFERICGLLPRKEESLTNHVQIIEILKQMKRDDLHLLYHSNNAFLESVGFSRLLQDIDCINYSPSLLKLKPCYCNENTRIVCSERITLKNLHLLCHILNNANVKINTKKNQVIYINMRQAFDCRLASERINRMHIYSKYKTDITLLKRIIIDKCILCTKRKDYKFTSSCMIDFSRIMIEANTWSSSPNRDITQKVETIIMEHSNLAKQVNLIKVYIPKYSLPNHDSPCGKSKTLNSKLSRNMIIILNRGTSFNRIRIIASGNLEKITTMTIHPKLTFAISIGKKSVLPGESDEITVRSDILKENLLSNLLIYLQNVQLMSEFVVHPDFLNYKKHSKYYAEVTLSVCCDSPYTIDAHVSECILKIQDQINNSYRLDNGTTEIHRTVLLLSDILERNETYETLTDRIKLVLKRNGIYALDFESIFDEFLIDGNCINATNDFDVSNIYMNAYKVVVYVIVRNNFNALIYLVRRNVEHDLRTLHNSFTMNVYTDALNSLARKNQNDLENSTWMEGQSDISLVSVVFSTMLQLRFNMLGNIKNQILENRKQFDQKLCALMNHHLSENMRKMYFYDQKPESNAQDVKFTSILEREIEAIVQIIENAICKFQSEAMIKITTVSLNRPDQFDIKKINAMNSILKALK